MNRARTAALALLPALLAAACALPPETPAPALHQSVPLLALPAATQSGAWPDARWWLRYQDATLTALIERALADAPSMAEASARFDSAEQQLRLAAAARGVQIDALASARRERLSEHGMFPPEFLGFTWYSQVDLGVRARYSFDWWGRRRAEIDAAISSARAAEAESAAAALTLATSIADSYFGWQADQARLALARERLALADRQLHVTGTRVAAGLDRSDAIERATASQAGAQEQVALVEGSAELRRVALAALVGCAPTELPPLSAHPLPATSATLPPELGIDLLARRADITASRWRVEAALQGVKAARAAFLPDISLDALAGLSSIEYGKLFDAGSRVPTAGLAVHLPVFDGGALRAQHAARNAELHAAIASYDATLISAAREVGQQVVLRQQIEGRLSARVAQADAVARMLATAERRVQQGLTDVRPQIDAAQSMLEQRAAELELQAAAVAADIALIQALGGGYESPRNPS